MESYFSESLDNVKSLADQAMGWREHDRPDKAISSYNRAIEALDAYIERTIVKERIYQQNSDESWWAMVNSRNEVGLYPEVNDRRRKKSLTVLIRDVEKYHIAEGRYIDFIKMGPQVNKMLEILRDERGFVLSEMKSSSIGIEVSEEVGFAVG